MASHYDVRRTIRVGAPASTVHALVDALHEWPRWSPWEVPGAGVLRHFDGPASGVGATYGWDCAEGAGRLRILRSEPTRIDAEFLVERPFRCQGRVTFDLAQVVEDDGVRCTRVTWTLTGRRPTLDRLGDLGRTDRVVVDLDRGLARLKEAAETSLPAAS